MKILILGSSGTLGTGIEEACREREIEFVSLTHNDFEIADFNESDITKHGCDALINCAGLMGVPNCEEDPNKTFAINSIPVRKLAQICEKNNIIFIQPSSHGVFDGTNNPVTEVSLPNPVNTYSISKYVAERFTLNFCTKHYIPRLPILFGKKKNEPVGFIDKIPLWIKSGNPLRMATDKCDTLAYNKDVGGKIIDLILEKMPYGIYHIFNKGNPSYYDYACKVRDLLALNTEIQKALDSDFPSKGPKAKSIQMSSIKISTLRGWEGALFDFIKNNEGYFG